MSKVVSNYVSGAWVLGYGQRFVYDGWNLVAILDAASSARLLTFVWGDDLSGTRQGAGVLGVFWRWWCTAGPMRERIFRRMTGMGTWWGW
ncbi:hypothetical protein NXS98_07530 [Fontisphaera persica]|uniref:hypothetical protein n=1 Tax=Fontisphaera persica TaxID=2974023 RepID=UPI0024BF3102|nr:hypothetical protein [Fontisphaera persica]WCJ60961.1 hypothetical protein NXS98_07530 [Fontisphaera persica]